MIITDFQKIEIGASVVNLMNLKTGTVAGFGFITHGKVKAVEQVSAANGAYISYEGYALSEFVKYRFLEAGSGSWPTRRDVIINALKFIDPQYSEKQRKILEGVRMYLLGEKNAEVEYKAAMDSGARSLVLDKSVEEIGTVYIPCCSETPDLVELTIYDYQVYTCPGCKQVWAMRMCDSEVGR